MIYAIILILGFASCRKTEVENVFYTSPEARMADTLQFIRTGLTGAKYGWKGGFSTGLKGGYGFYFDFKNDQTVSMVSDYSTATSTDPKVSTYRVSAAFLPTLLFDTYNYISIMADPVPGVAGGTAGQGYKSDIEFLYFKAKGDTIFFKGKKYNQPFTLIKATEAEQQLFLKNGITTYKNGFSTVFNNNYVFPYLNGTQNAKLGVELDYTGKTAKFSYINAAGGIDSIVNSSFYYTVSELNLVKYIPFNGKVIKSLKFQATNVMADLTDNTNVNLGTQNTPLYSFESAFAYNKNFKKLVSGNPIPGVTANVHVFDKVKELFTASTRSVTNMYFGFNNSTTATFYIAYTSGTSSFVASATYEYRKEGNKIFLKRVSVDGPGNWTTRAVEVAPVNALFGTGDEREFMLDWVSSTDKTVKFPIGAIKSATNQNNMLYGRLGE